MPGQSARAAGGGRSSVLDLADPWGPSLLLAISRHLQAKVSVSTRDRENHPGNHRYARQALSTSAEEKYINIYKQRFR